MAAKKRKTVRCTTTKRSRRPRTDDERALERNPAPLAAPPVVAETSGTYVRVPDELAPLLGALAEAAGPARALANAIAGIIGAAENARRALERSGRR